MPLKEPPIALRDGRHLMHDPDGMPTPTTPAGRAEPQSIYPQGFSVKDVVRNNFPFLDWRIWLHSVVVRRLFGLSA